MTEAAQTLSAARSNVAGSPSEEEVRQVCMCVHTVYIHNISSTCIDVLISCAIRSLQFQAWLFFFS
jgi:hypothetical protein